MSPEKNIKGEINPSFQPDEVGSSFHTKSINEDEEGSKNFEKSEHSEYVKNVSNNKNILYCPKKEELDLAKGPKSLKTKNILSSLRFLDKNDPIDVQGFNYINKGFDATDEEGFQSYPESNKDDSKAVNVTPKIEFRLWTQIFGAVVSACVHLSVGTVIGYTGVTLPAMVDPESNDIILSQFEAAIFSSIVNAGALVGSLTSSVVMVWLGQRSTLLVFLPVGIFSWILLGFAQEYWLLLLARIIQGIVVGITAGCANNYVVEVAHSSVRGRLFALIDMNLQLGFLFVYLVGSTSLSWRNVGLICGIISLSLPFLGMIFLPHSPRWLAMRGRKEEAKTSLAFFRGSKYDVQSEMDSINLQLNCSAKGSVGDQLKLLVQPSIFKRFFLLAVLLFASHFTGNFAMIAYSVSIFESAHVPIDPYLSTNIAAIARVIGVAIYLAIADKFGRKPLIMIPLFLSGLCMVALGAFFAAQALLDDVSFLSWLPLTSIVLYTFFTCMSHPVLMLMRSELLPTSVRAVGVGLLYFMFFLGTFSVAISYPYMVQYLGSHMTFWIYGTTSFVMVFIIGIFIPETQGKTLEQIDEMFNQKPNTNKS